jgi:hypothetical protein
MRQGLEGRWRFTLSYTAEPGNGAYLFIFYLLLGHLSRIIGWSNPITFHVVRVICSTLMLVSLYYFFKTVLINKIQLRIAYLLAVFGSGIGWLAMMFGVFSADFWVAEAYPFLSAYANPHFPLGLAILLWIFTLAQKSISLGGFNISVWNRINVFLGSIVLGIVMPFGVVIVAMVLGCLGIWEIAERYQQNGLHGVSNIPEVTFLVVIVCLGGGPILLYYYWVSHTDPLLAGWNMQNLTPAPPLWDFMISFLPVLIFAVPGALLVAQNRIKLLRILVVWAILGLLLLWIPFGLQRRFILGLYIPFAGLTSFGIDRLMKMTNKRHFAILIGIFGLATLTNLTVILVAFTGIQTIDQSIYITQGESRAFDWLIKNTEEEAVILTGPDTGLFLPAHTGRSVFYGHPFETVDAENQKKKVSDFFRYPNSENSLTLLEASDYVFWGPRENDISSENLRIELPVIYETAGVTIFRVTR